MYKNSLSHNFNDSVLNVLNHDVQHGYLNLLSTINSGINLLFWDIGTLINNASGQSSITGEISSALSPVFGEYLNTENLTLMRLFADKCPLDTIGLIAGSINRQYIPALLNLEEDKAWIFYWKLMLIDSLTPAQLEKEVLSNSFEKKKIDEEGPERMSDFIAFYQNTAELYFGEKGGNAFRKLFEPRDLNDIAINSFIINYGENEVIMAVYKLISEFQAETHFTLNFQFNMLLKSVGARIIRGAEIAKTTLEDYINKCVQELGNSFPTIFNKTELLYCTGFAEQYKITNEIVEIASWPYIKALLSNDSESIVLPSTVYTKHNTRTTETMNGSNIAIITEKLIIPVIHPESDINRNIFKNAELSAFLIHI